MAKKTFIVTHPKLFLRDEESGKLKHFPKGSKVSLDEKAVGGGLKRKLVVASKAGEALAD